MSGLAAFEGELNSIVKEYLAYNGFEKSVSLFERECVEKGHPVASLEVKPKPSQKLAAVQEEMLESFESGRSKRFFDLWTEHVPRDVRNEDAVAQKLEFYLNIHFAIYPAKSTTDHSNAMEAMSKFKHYIETRGASLSQTAEFLPFYALPFVPNPRSHPSYQALFEDSWEANLRRRLEKFLTSALRSIPPPRLFELYRGGTGSKGVINYTKLKTDLATGPERTQALLLQALRWKLTKVISNERDLTLADYVKHDVLGCVKNGQHRQAMLDLLSSKSDLLRQYMARLLNTFASLSEGRSYLATNTDLLTAIISCLQNESRDAMVRDNALGCVQKLSLRRQLQMTMIREGIISWLVKILKDTDSISDYMLEYSLALLMNLCLRTAGKQRCASIARDILKVLTDLIGNDNQEVIPYVNGTLYSILAIPMIRDQAKAMDMETILERVMKDGQPDMNRQIEYIIKQLNSTEEPDGNQSDDEDDDEEEDQDTLESDLDKNEILKLQPGELAGEHFISTYYMDSTSAVAGQRKKRPTDSVLATEELLRRPVTPSYMKSDHASSHAPPSRHAVRQTTSRDERRPSSRDIQRPPTRSGSRPNSATDLTELAREKPKDNEWLQAFNARPKIMRTPDLTKRPTSRGSEGNHPLQPTFSDSLPTPRPGSGGRPTSQPEKKNGPGKMR